MISDAKKFFSENTKRYATVRSDPLNYNLNAGLLKLVEELQREVRKLHQEIAHVSHQVAALQR
jgi:hypothetical protein